MTSSVAIKQIDKGTVNQICSGQVVLCLATAVKELLENSLDAGSTSIKIRLKDYGSQCIEVLDNGSGVEEVNFQALTLKHHTSKIKDFADLTGVETFGFRGEALSSLCTMSHLQITTRHCTEVCGTTLKFDQNGIIKDSCKIARQIGTTVTVEDIFYTLPVRHKEFIRNIKKEFARMCQVLYAYGLQTTGVSFSCINITAGNKKTTVMETTGESVKCNIVSIYSAKQLQSLLHIKEVEPSGDILNEYGLTNATAVGVFHLEGYISSCCHGSGRSSADRQYYFINSRPVDNMKVSKLVNELYHQFNAHQFPFVILNIKVALDAVDINLTPDKRQILIDNKKLLLATLKSTFLSLFVSVPSSLPVVTLCLTSSSKPVVSTPGFLDKLSQFKSPRTRHIQPELCKTQCSKTRSRLGENVSKAPQPKMDQFVIKDKVINFVGSDVKEPVMIEKDFPEKVCQLLHNDNQQLGKKPDVCTKRLGNSSDDSGREDMEVVNIKRKPVETEEIHLEEKRMKLDIEPSDCRKRNRTNIVCKISLSSVRKLQKFSKKQSDGNMASEPVRFLSGINPASNKTAEAELTKELTKDMFKDMLIVGQFNHGFIITRLNSDLFLIDQHATDEKYNFETLQQTTVMQTQRLISPQILDMTVDKQVLLKDHAEVFRKNGFDVTIDEEAPPNERVKLLAIPYSKTWLFGKDDVDELLFMLEDAPLGKMCRPSRLRDMFASRACRKSVMIGTPLSHQEMRRLVNHMGEIQQPWNCPHGRPTIRHLINLNMIHDSLK